MIKRITFLLSAFVLTASLLSTPAFADTISLSLDNPAQYSSGGSVLSFVATVFAPNSNSGTVFLNGDSSNVDFPLTLSDDGFFFNFPFSLAPGESFTDVLFTLTVPGSITPGTTYDGFFAILGGADSNASNLLSTVSFQVNPQASPVPEPGSILLLATGLTGLVATVRRKRAIC